jgi:hypothetical protein
MKIDPKAHAQAIVRALANALKIASGSWCLCGSGKQFELCCYNNSGDRLVFLEGAFEKAIKYRESQGGRIERVPVGLFSKFARSSLSRFRCLYPGCGERTVSCHSIPENILRERFGDHCSEFRLQDGSAIEQFTKTGINKAGTLPVFCSMHDNGLFRNVDALNIDWRDHKQLFSLTLKAMAFSLRKVQYLLGIDSQVEIVRPVLISESGVSTGSNVTLDISHLHEQYIRFQILYDLFRDTIAAYEAANWDYFSHCHRHIDYRGNIVFAGFLNPSHDLEGVRVNRAPAPISMACNVLTKDNGLHALFSCAEGASIQCYENLLRQLRECNEEALVAALNNVMTVASEKPLMPADFVLSEKQALRIPFLQQKAGRALNSSSSEVLDLRDADQAVQFIR